MSQTTVYNLEGQVKLNDKDFSAKAKRVHKTIKELSQQMQIDAGLAHPTQEYRTLAKAAELAGKEIERLKKKQGQLSNQHTKSDEYKKMAKDVQNAEAELDGLIEKQIGMAELGPAVTSSPVFQQLDEQIEQARQRLERMQADLKGIAETGATDKEAKEWFEVCEAIERAEKDLKMFKSEMASKEASGTAYNNGPYSNVKEIGRRMKALRMMSKGKNIFGNRSKWNEKPAVKAIKRVHARIIALKTATGPARAGIKKVMVGAVNDAKSAVGWISKMGRGFPTVLQRLKMFPPIQKTVGRGFLNIHKHANKMKRGLMMGAGIRGLVRLGAAGAIALYSIRMMKEGMQNLVAYDATTQNSLNQLKASLLTLKNALATAFAPVLNVVAPILSRLIGWLSAAATAVAHFMAAITGQSKVVVAKKANAGYAASLDSAADSAGKADKASKKYQRTLMGFDEINKLEEKDKSGGGGGSGGGAGGGVGDPGSMFETVDVSKKAKDWAKKIKEAWKKADFTEIGAAVANKLNEALEKIPWGKINKTAWKIAHSIGTFINGFVETFNWKLLGKTISNGILVALNFLSTLLETIHWQSIGKAIVDFISGIKWGALFKGASRLAGNILGALAGVLAGVAKSLGKKVKGYFQKSIQDAGGSIIKGLLLGIGRAIKNIGKWIKNNIFKPFINGFKKAFGIGSPSKEMKTQGGYMIEGLLEGLKDKISSVLDWFKELPGKIKEKIGDIAINIVSNAGDFASGLKDKAIDVVANFTSWVKGSSFGSTVSDMVSKFTSWVKGFDTDTVSGWIAKFTGKVVDTAKVAAETVKGWVAKFTSRVVDTAVTAAGTVKGWTAKFTKRIIKFAIGTISGFKAKFTSWTKKFKSMTISGFVAKITKWVTTTKAPTVNAGSVGGGRLAGGGIYRGGRWQPVTAAASGGSFSTGQMFIAREAGPELVGKIGNNTAVMNNEQIVASVSAGVASAVAGVMKNLDGKPTNVILQGDAEKLFRVMQQKANAYTRSTGKSPFPV